MTKIEGSGLLPYILGNYKPPNIELNWLEELGIRYIVDNSPRSKKGAGRPKALTEFDNLDCRRAEMLRQQVLNLTRLGIKTPKTTELISLTQWIERYGVDESEWVFARGWGESLATSVSRGKKTLGIRKDWSGGIFENPEKDEVDFTQKP
jgi:hypothetical protein